MDLDETHWYIIGSLVLGIFVFIFFTYFKPNNSSNIEIKDNHSDQSESNKSNKDYSCVGDKCVMIQHD